ncbi:CcmD family protein [Salidesulfovibrio onnuriiensis]|nr:CcmD family protein [Salidesulfovibrio onnuriiensis]
MSATTYLFIANCVIWLGLAGYVVFLAGRSKALDRRIRQLELLGDDNGN